MGFKMKKLKVAVYGLGHLGQVTTACLAELGCEVYAFGRYECLEEPALQGLLIKNKEKIEFNGTNYKVDYCWICLDTPVRGEDKADVDFVLKIIDRLLYFINEKTPIIISSQLPIGTIAKLEKKYPNRIFACVPENLRHGTAIKNFLEPDRIVIGTRTEEDRKLLKPLFEKITKNLIWMNIEEAEMVKHFINSFLATSITFANEFGDICEKKGIDYNEVLKGILSEQRIGSKLPLRAGKAYTGKTLARDIKYLIDMSGNKFFKTVRELNNKRLKK